jgi:hypothetical protein
MRPRMQPCRQVIEQERRQWMPFQRALAKEDQEAFDRLCACAKEPRQAEVQLGRPWRFEVVWMAVCPPIEASAVSDGISNTPRLVSTSLIPHLTHMAKADTGGEFLGRDANQPERSALIGYLNHRGSACPAE